MLIIVDGSSLLHQAVNIKNSKGSLGILQDKTFGAYWFLNSLSNLASKNRHWCSFVIAWDSGIPLHRRKLSKEYKPHKKFVEESGVDFSEYYSSENLQEPQEGMELFLERYNYSKDLLHKILPYTGCLSIKVPNCEADDIVAVFVNKLKDNQDEIIILSSDRDLDQLLEDNVFRYDAVKKQNIYKTDVIEKHDLIEKNWKRHWLYNKALLGDTSDNIKGFYGMGEKAAQYYSRQIVEKGLADFTKLEPSSKFPNALQSLVSDQKRFWNNCKMMDLKYIISMKEPLYQKINEEVCSCGIYEPDLYNANQILCQESLQTALSSAQNIYDSNQNNPPKEFIKLFL